MPVVDSSHTNFDTSAFTASAVAGAASLAGALGAGLANYSAAQQDQWSQWTIEQLRAALNCSEAMRYCQFKELQESRAENVALKRQILHRDFAVRQAAANRAWARR